MTKSKEQHKIHLKWTPPYLGDEKGFWKVRFGNEHLTAEKVLVFIQLMSGDDGELVGVGVVEPYGKDTLVFRNN